MNSTYLAYRTTAATGANGLGMLISLYDTLAGDLRRAAEAQRGNDIATRCHEANHALLVIGHLENWLAQGTSGELTARLASFYAKLRSDILKAQAAQSADLLEQRMSDVLEIRTFWQKLEESNSTQPEMLQAAPIAPPTVFASQASRIENSWSA